MLHAKYTWVPTGWAKVYETGLALPILVAPTKLQLSNAACEAMT
jgi:hypothetical protein